MRLTTIALLLVSTAALCQDPVPGMPLFEMSHTGELSYTHLATRAELR